LEFLRQRQSRERQFNGGRRIGVKQIELIEQHLREADGVADALAVAWEIVDLVGALAASCAEQAADMYPAFMFARGAAVNGDLPRAFQIADLWLIHAAACCARYSSWTCCGAPVLKSGEVVVTGSGGWPSAEPLCQA
jgi:hypothetical protein